MRNRWQQAVLIAAAATGLVLGMAGWPAQPLKATVESEQIRRELYEAIHRELEKAGLSERDMPRRILEYKKTGRKRYWVHMEMGVGEGWFEVEREDTQWKVRGLSPPSPKETPGSQE